MIPTIYTIAFNEELMMPYFIRHYRNMFPGCKIVVYDNESTDRTVEIVNSFENTEVITYKTDGKLNDETYLEIKNNCWRDAETAWVLIADVDEHCYININELLLEDEIGVTMIQFKGYNMVGMEPDEINIDINQINYGVRASSYDKSYLFKKAFSGTIFGLLDVNYGPGCHDCKPHGFVRISLNVYTCKHYKYIHPDYMVRRHAVFASRLSEVNLKRGYGAHYLKTEAEIREEFSNAVKRAYEIN